MEPVVLLVGGGLAVAGALVGIRRRAMRGRAWRFAAVDLGVEMKRATDRRAFLVGTVGGYPIRVTEWGGPGLVDSGGQGVNDEPWSTKFEIGPLPWLPKSARLHRDSALNRIAAGGWGARILTGDREFDGAVLVYGRAEGVLPLLDHDGRTALREGVRDWAISVEGGEIQRRTTGIEWDRRRLVGTVRAMVAIAAGLDPRGKDGVGQLLWMARRDPVPAVRERAARALAEWHRDDPRTAGLAAELAGSALAPRKLLALELLPAGDAVALATAVATDARHDDEHRNAARRWLAERGFDVPKQPGGQLSVVDDAEARAAEGRLSAAAGEPGALGFAADDD